jgi:hypothetical protein
LHAGKAVLDEPLDVDPDPRASWTQAQYVARHNFLKELDDELSQIDVALNRIDALPAVEHTDARPVYAMLTSGVVNSEDQLWRADRLRERLTTLQGTVALSQGPPLPPHEREAAGIRAQFDTAMATYRAFLEAHHLPPDTLQEVCS